MLRVCENLVVISRRTFSIAAALALLVPQPVQAAKNVILMVADGSGYNSWLATSMYQGKLGKQVYESDGWIALSCTTFPLNLSSVPTGDLNQDPAVVYSPAKAWDVYDRPIASDARPRGTVPFSPTRKLGQSPFAGYTYLIKSCTDSAAAATAMATGQKTYNRSINWSNDDRPMRGQTIAEMAKAHGKSVGVITTVQWSHATPAGLGGAHSKSRDNYVGIANEMLDAPWLDVIMGAGHPDFDDDGRPLSEGKKRDFQYVGGETTWKALKAGERPWKLIERKADFEALSSGPTPRKVLGTVEAATTLQQRRATSGGSAAAEAPPGHAFSRPLNRKLPSLAVMARAAINCLDDNPHGFYLMIEGGAVDWANHSNEPDRMIEEQAGFVQAVEAVVAWVESNSNWNDTLLVLTADHECGLLWGPDSSKTAFQPLEDRGRGHMPGMKYNSHGHSNSLVPLYARGAGSQRFSSLTKGTDTKAAATWHISGHYVDNTDIFRVMEAEVTEQGVDNRVSA